MLLLDKATEAGATAVEKRTGWDHFSAVAAISVVRQLVSAPPPAPPGHVMSCARNRDFQRWSVTEAAVAP